MGARINLVLDNEVKEDFHELVPAGRRSEFANEAIRAQLAQLRRRMAAERLEKLRRKGPTVPTSEIVDLLRQARAPS